MDLKGRFSLVFMFLVPLTYSQSLQDALSLYKKVKNGYDKDVRPGADQSIPTGIYMDVSIMSITEFEEKSNKLSITMGFQIKWHDERIQWNESDYGGMKAVQLPKSDVWIPEIGLINMHDDFKLLSSLDTRIRYDSSGFALWQTGGLYSVICSADLAFYPFDKQECNVSLAQVGYSIAEVLIYPNALQKKQVGSTFPNGVWELVNNSAFKTIMEEVGLQIIDIQLKLKRRFDFYVVTFVIPLVVVVFCNIFVFLIPPDSGERVSFSVTILLAVTVFMTIVSDTLPNSSYPHLSYLCFSILVDLILSTIITTFAIISMRIYYRDQFNGRVPDRLKAFVRCWCCKIGNSSVNNSNNKTYKSSEDDDIYIHHRPIRVHKHMSYIIPSSVAIPYEKTFEHAPYRNGKPRGLPKNKGSYDECQNDVTWRDVGFCFDMLMLIICAGLLIGKAVWLLLLFSSKESSINA